MSNFALNIGEKKQHSVTAYLPSFVSLCPGGRQTSYVSECCALGPLDLQQLDDFDPQFLALLDALPEHLPAKIGKWSTAGRGTLRGPRECDEPCQYENIHKHKALRQPQNKAVRMILQLNLHD